jgi:hypothetical protein
MTSERDDWLEEVAAEIRSDPADDPAARMRVMAAIRGDRPAGGDRDATAVEMIRRWLLRRRTIAISPLAVGLAAAALAALVWFVRLPTERRATAPATAEQAGQSGSTTQPVVDFVIRSPGATRVALVGDFNNWDPQRTPLRPTDRQGEWAVSLPLPPGVYAYAYVVDGHLQPDLDAPRMPGHDFVGGSSVVVVRKRPV